MRKKYFLPIKIIKIINRFGVNIKRVPKIRTLWEKILENLENRILKILFISAIVAFIIGRINSNLENNLIEDVSILVAVTISIIIGVGF